MYRSASCCTSSSYARVARHQAGVISLRSFGILFSLQSSRWIDQPLHGLLRYPLPDFFMQSFRHYYIADKHVKSVNFFFQNLAVVVH